MQVSRHWNNRLQRYRLQAIRTKEGKIDLQVHAENEVQRVEEPIAYKNKLVVDKKVIATVA